jgi:hypothetical protein
MSEVSASRTTDHQSIRRWAEERGGRPAAVRGTGGGDDPGILRIDFEGTEPEGLERIDWHEFFDKFEESKLAFLYQEKIKSGEVSRFFKFVRRD